MEILNLKTKDLNQNEYSTNKLTKNKIGALYTFPIDYTPNDCLSCEGYLLDIVDYKELHAIIGSKLIKQMILKRNSEYLITIFQVDFYSREVNPE